MPCKGMASGIPYIYSGTEAAGSAGDIVLNDGSVTSAGTCDWRRQARSYQLPATPRAKGSVAGIHSPHQRHELHPVTYIGLHVNTRGVVLYGLKTDVKPVGYLLVTQSVAYLGDYLRFTRRDLVSPYEILNTAGQRQLFRYKCRLQVSKVTEVQRYCSYGCKKQKNN